MAQRKRKTPDDGETGNSDSWALDPTAATMFQGVAKQQAHRGIPSVMTAEARDYQFRTLYEKEPDFALIGKIDSDFATFLKDGRNIDWHDPLAVKQVTISLLRHDFDLTVDLPDDRLCPPVPNRHCYLVWIKDLMSSTSNRGKLRGLDIGTGASCIYPLLGTAQTEWDFVATDVDDKSLSYAMKNAKLNGLESRVMLLKRELGDKLIPIEELGNESLDFTMTNPPFYESEEEMKESAENKNRPPFSTCTGAPVEMICPGGEVAFVGRLLDESLELRERIGWYSAMLGKLSSLETLVGRLRENQIDNYAVAKLSPGRATRRWVLAWSFRPQRPSEEVARGLGSDQIHRKVLPLAVDAHLRTMPLGQDLEPMIARLKQVLESLPLVSWTWNQKELSGSGRAHMNVWSRSARRRKAQDEAEDAEPTGESKFGFRIFLRTQLSEKTTELHVRWLEGHDHTLFETFQAFLRSRLNDNP